MQSLGCSGRTKPSIRKGNAILTAQSQEDGVFLFENVPYGNWLVKELQPAEGFLPNEEVYRKHGQFEFTAPAILFACLIFTLTAPLYIWTIL